MAGGDPREWTPFDDDDEPAALYLAFCEAAFWKMVWTQRVSRLTWNTCEHCKVENDAPLRFGIWAILVVPELRLREPVDTGTAL